MKFRKKSGKYAFIIKKIICVDPALIRTRKIGVTAEDR